MTTPRVTRCPDGHYRRVIYGLGPYIADYPEQVLLACIVQGWCPQCVKANHATIFFLILFRLDVQLLLMISIVTLAVDLTSIQTLCRKVVVSESYGMTME
jgi:hypothetical protein